MCIQTVEELVNLETSFNLLGYALSVAMETSEPKTIYYACKIIATACKVTQNAKTMKRVKGQEWVKATRKTMAEI